MKKLETPIEHRAVRYFPQIFFRFSLLVVQYTLRYILLICSFLVEFKKVYAASTKRFTGGLTYDHLQRDLGNLSKLPKHMSFVINEDVGTDYCDIANLVVWAIAMGIPYISLYERHGILKAGEVRLGKIIEEKINSLFGSKEAEGINVILKNSSTKYENGIIYPKRVCIQLLSEEDGKSDIVETAKMIASDYSGKKVKFKDIDIAYVNKSLKATKHLPDPDLAIQFGSIQSLMGYLPWQTRVTEIHHVSTHKNISYNMFLNLLQRYSKCNQRFGK